MIKKIVLGTLFTGLLALLVVGGINRTVSKTEAGTENRGQGERATETSAGKSNGPGSNRLGSEVGEEDCNDGESDGVGRTEVDEWVELFGAVAEVDEHEMLVELENGENLSVSGRPWRFALESAFEISNGDAVRLVGFYEGDRFEVGTLTNNSSGQSLQIRDESGRPIWAGGGRRGT